MDDAAVTVVGDENDDDSNQLLIRLAVDGGKDNDVDEGSDDDVGIDTNETTMVPTTATKAG